MLETRIEELTAAVKALTEALSKTQAPNPVTAPLEDIQPAKKSQSAATSVSKPVVVASGTHQNFDSSVETPNDPPSSSDTTSGEQSQPTGESSSPANDDEAQAQIEAERNAAPELTYNDHVKPATLKLSQKMGREAAIAVLGRFGVKGAQNLDTSQWAEYIAHCESVMNGGEV